MNQDTALLTLVNRLRLPPQDQAKLAFCDSARAAKVADWAHQLPATRISHTSVLLYQALPEISRLDTSASNRLQMLEHLRPYVQQCIQGLAKNFLNKPLILPQAARKTAVIAQALQKHMSNGYCLVAKTLVQQHTDGKFKADQLEILSLAIHRAITGMGLQLLRNAQIYTPVSNQLWQEVHALYGLAEHLQLLKKSCVDPLLKLNRACTIEQAYFRILLLACSRPNQLRQNEVGILYDTLEDWARMVHFTDVNGNERNLFVVDLDSASAPIYKNTADPDRNLREMDVQPLLESIHKQQEHGDQSQIIAIPLAIADHLINHLTTSWGELHQRQHPRRAAQAQLEVAVGLTSIHYHLAGQVEFQEFLKLGGRRGSGSQFESSQLSSEYDPWSEATDAGMNTKAGIGKELDYEGVPAPTTKQHPSLPIYPVHTIDASSGGYCLDWRDEVPPQAKAGELVGLREPGRRYWNIGVIRWLKQSKGASQLGIQVLAPQARAVAAKQLQKVGNDNVYMRALLIPPSSTDANQLAGIVTAAHPFRANNKVKLNEYGSVSNAFLTELRYATGCMSLFSFRRLESPQSIAESNEPSPDQGFDSQW
jgi:hypothetical protein